MPLLVAFDIADESWECAVPDLRSEAESTVRSALSHAAPQLAASPRPVEIGLTFADDRFVQSLNRAYRGKDKPTNVLSFPVGVPPVSSDEFMPLPLGDVVLAFGTVMREADESGKSCADHTKHLLVHGVLHLLGHDHEAQDEAERMESLETQILADIGVADPYILNMDVN